jgi:hypothetical protein
MPWRSGPGDRLLTRRRGRSRRYGAIRNTSPTAALAALIET